MMAGSGGGDWFDGGGGGTQVDVAGCVGPQELIGLLSMVEAGALLSMGTTSDGGALGVTVTVDGRWRREYVRSADELSTWLAEAVPAATDALAALGARSPRPGASDAPRSRSRRR